MICNSAKASTTTTVILAVSFAGSFGAIPLWTQSHESRIAAPHEHAQVPRWSADDVRFFLHGSMGTEVVPETVLNAMRATYPELVPNFGDVGLIEDQEYGLPIGFSRREVPHLGGLRSIGINCASCHVADVVSERGGKTTRVLGATGHFDAEAFFGAVAAATFQTADPANMKRFLGYYLMACDPAASSATQEMLASELKRQSKSITAMISDHQADEHSAPASKLYELDPTALALDANYLERSRDLAPVVRSVLRLFHNMRAALHIPHRPPETAPPRSGPGRNNAFGTLSVALFGEPTIYAPAKFGLAWNLHGRDWVHWDGNTRSPIVRNLAASLGLGAPLIGKRGVLDFSLVERHTRLSEQIESPRYPWTIDGEKAMRGKVLFEARCTACHVHAPGEAEKRLFPVDEVKTDPNRARIVNDHQAELYNKFFAELELSGYKAPGNSPVRSTQKYVACDLAGVWARSPYLHNGSVRTMTELLTPAAQRAKRFRRGARLYDEGHLGYTDRGAFLFDTTTEGNSNAGHEYGTDLTADEKKQLIEYLKSL